MLEMRQFCECCGKNLAPDSAGAMICSFECTFCAECAANVLHDVCPNCGGELAKRPSRSAKLLVKNPPSFVRIVKENGCLRIGTPVPAIA